jgi:hypothetical protein
MATNTDDAPAPADSSMSGAAFAANGTIDGHVVRGPGRDPRAGGDGQGASIPVPGDPITIQDTSGATVASLATAQDGSFRVDLPAGCYAVVEAIYGTAQSVTVQDNVVTPVVMTIAAAPG